MEIPQDDSFMEIIGLLRKRDKLCNDWFHRINRELKEGALTYEEWEKQIEEIEAEQAKTAEAFNRLETYLKNVKITGK